MIQSGNQRSSLSPHPHRRSDEWKDGLQTLSRVPGGERPLLLPLSPLLGLPRPATAAAAPGTTLRLRWFLGPSSAAPSPARAGGRRRRARRRGWMGGGVLLAGRPRRSRRPGGLSVLCACPVCARVYVALQSGCQTESAGEC